MKKLEITKEQLEYLYHEKSMSALDISKELSIGYNTVKRRLNEYGIKKKTKSEVVTIGKSKRPKKITNLVCSICNSHFTIKNSLIDKAKNHFCSVSCSAIFNQRINSQNKMTGKNINCLNCNKSFYKIKSLLDKQEKHFCTRACFGEWNKKMGYFKGQNNPRYKKVLINCSFCNEEFHKLPKIIFTDNYCSIECMGNHYTSKLKGSNNPNFKGGYRPYYGKRWKKISIKIRERDSFTCRRCNRHVNNLIGNELLHVHHIIPFRSFENPDDANFEQNLITLCSTCHPIVEKNGIDF